MNNETSIDYFDSWLEHFDIENSLNSQPINIEYIKSLGKNKSTENLNLLLDLYKKDFSIDIKREIVSSIGRQNNDEEIYNFILNEYSKKIPMDIIYQMYRTILYKNKIPKFQELDEKILLFYNNEMLYKMKYFYSNKNTLNIKKEKTITKPTLFIGDSEETLKKLKEQEINLIFTSPPYYNAKEYVDYTSYSNYLNKMYKILLECNRILEDGRFIVINVSPVITKRPGREFESIRYPIHFDFHNILTKSGFYFVDEIIWIKPEATVKNRVGGYQQTRCPLSYKPNCITESLMIYRKNAPFLLDKNILKYKNCKINKETKFNSSNCWYINPKSDKNHPAVFPDELCEEVLKYYSFETDIVLDPFAGSGTFGRVAKTMNRIPVLCEKNEKYVNLLKGKYDNF
jgi:DNA modification methylase